MIQTIAAIDLFDGKAVRLYQGNYNQVTTYGDPYTLAKSLDVSTCDRIHIINLNGARGEKYRNLEIIARLAKSLTKPIQVGGGIRSLEDAERLLAMGVDIIVSTLFYQDYSAFKDLVLAYPRRVFFSLDLAKGQADITQLGALGYSGAIIGKALYEGVFTC